MPISDRLELEFERWYPLAGAGCAAGIVSLFNLSGTDGFRDLLQASVNLGAITVGFLATSKAILFAIGQKETVLALQSGNKWSMLIDYLMHAIYSSFLLAILSGLLLLVPFKCPAAWHHWIACLWVFSLVLSFLTSFRIIRFVSQILKMK
jgi:hypothetical protein